MFKVNQLHPPESSDAPEVRSRLIWRYENPRPTKFWGALATLITTETGERIYVRETPDELMRRIDLMMDEND